MYKTFDGIYTMPCVWNNPLKHPSAGG